MFSQAASPSTLARLAGLALVSVALGCGATDTPGPAVATATTTAAATASVVQEARCPSFAPDAQAAKDCIGDKMKAIKCIMDMSAERLEAGNEQGAVDAFIAAIHRRPELSFAYVRLADLLMNLDLYGQAEAVLKEAARLVTPERRTNIHLLLATIYGDADRFDLSVAELEAALALKKDNAVLRFNLGMSYTKLAVPPRDKARKMLEGFVAKACKPPVDARNGAPCEMATVTIKKLGSCPDCFKASKAPTMKRPPLKRSKCSIAPPSSGGPSLPMIVVPALPIRQGDAFTVWGASHHLRNQFHRPEVSGKAIDIVGHVVATNFDRVPRCAVHRTGKADPPDCVAPVPTIYIADNKDERHVAIKVMGWASNWAQVVEVMHAIDNAKPGEKVQLMDEFFGMNLPNPIPAVGAHVRVTGRYGMTYTKSTSGSSADPRYGILTADKITYLKRPPKPAQLPGYERTKK